MILICQKNQACQNKKLSIYSLMPRVSNRTGKQHA